MTFADIYDYDRPYAAIVYLREPDNGKFKSLSYYCEKYGIAASSIMDADLFVNGALFYFRDGTKKWFDM